MADIKTKYPSTSTTAVTLAVASLADDNTNQVAGRAGTAVDNTTNVDLDHLVSGFITAGTSPTASRVIEIWAYAPISMASGTPTYPDSITGTDAAKTMTSLNVKYAALKLVTAMTVDSTSNRAYYFSPVSIAGLFGAMPPFWGLFVVNRTGVALNATGGNHVVTYQRVQAQTV